MNRTVRSKETKPKIPKRIDCAVCSHDCLTTCALEVELIGWGTDYGYWHIADVGPQTHTHARVVGVRRLSQIV
jgi:hypothetical protein